MADRAARPLGSFRTEVDAAIADFGSEVREKLSDPDAEKEEQLRSPLENLLRRAGRALKLQIVPHGEVRLRHLQARPDFSVDVARMRVGYIELKAPTKGVPLTSSWKPKVNDAKQWEKLKALPNLIYGDGNNWGWYKYGQLEIHTQLQGDLYSAGRELSATDEKFALILERFFLWEPEKPENLKHLVSIVAGLCKILNDEVAEILRMERKGLTEIRLFEPLARDWRRLLYPGLSDPEFANAYAQTVTFALLLARVDGISFQDTSTHDVAKQLRKRHPLMGRALEVLTDRTIEHGGIIETLARVVGAVDWDRYAREDTDPYALLYEQFLNIYDPELRKRTGTYYTPKKLVSFMVRFVDEVIRTRLDYPLGIADKRVIVLDPAMGTGTYLAETIKLAANTIAIDEGDGAVPAKLRSLCDRLIGFEVQAGPYAIAELRISTELKEHGSELPDHMRLCVTDTLENPYPQQEFDLGDIYAEIARSQEDASDVKLRVPVLAVIGNPPYGSHARASGKWILDRSGATKRALIDDFRHEDRNLGYVLHDKYIYFWRWAIWKVFEAHPENPAGVVAFICPSSFVKGPGFAKMREYLRRIADEGWIIDLTPEDHQSDVPYRIFPDNSNPVCVAIFARGDQRRLTDPAVIHHISIPGLHSDKLRSLSRLRPDSTGFKLASSRWCDGLQPGPSAHWARFPLLADLMMWSTPGITPGRTWVYGPRREILIDRLKMLSLSTHEEQRLLFGTRPQHIAESVWAARVAAAVESLSGGTLPPLTRIAYGAFDRQYLIRDDRFVDRLRPELWHIRNKDQVYITEQHIGPIESGPGVLFSSLIPDRHHFMGRQGSSTRIFPLYLDSNCAKANFLNTLIMFLSAQLKTAITERDLLAYIACLISNAGYTSIFSSELHGHRGTRVPLTKSPELWSEAVAIGRSVIWLHTFGESYVDDDAGRSAGVPRLPPGKRPLVAAPGIPHSAEGMPGGKILYDACSETLHVGRGEIHKVSRDVYNYQVAGRSVLDRWFRSRGKLTRPRDIPIRSLDDVRDQWWHPDTTTDLLEVLNILSLLTQLESHQRDLLAAIISAPVITYDELKHSAAVTDPNSHYRLRPAPSNIEPLFQ
jgi:Type ISP C-terminal specificity domain/N-6 DNA Methylase